MEQNKKTFKAFVFMFLDNYVTGFIEFPIYLDKEEIQYLREVVNKYNKQHQRKFSINKEDQKVFVFENNQSGVSTIPGVGVRLSAYYKDLLQKEQKAMKKDFFEWE